MDQHTPPADDSVGPPSLYTITPILALGIMFYIQRIYTRVVPKYRLNASDYTCTIAVLAGTITYALFAAGVAHGFGRHSSYVTPEKSVKILQCLYGVTVVGLWASVFARISVACLLLQFATSRRWKLAVWAAIAFQVASLFAAELIELVQCRPIRAFWEPVPGAQCLSPSAMWTTGYVFTGIGMGSDLVLSVMPMFIIWKLARTIAERCLISFLMGMCLFATGVGVLKIIYSERFDTTSPDVFREMMPVFFWCRMEEVILIVACSAPLLKGPVEHQLGKLGLPTFQFTIRELVSLHSIRTSVAHRWRTPRSQHEPAGQHTANLGGLEANESDLEAGKSDSFVASKSGSPGNSVAAGENSGISHLAVTRAAAKSDDES